MCILKHNGLYRSLFVILVISKQAPVAMLCLRLMLSSGPEDRGLVFSSEMSGHRVLRPMACCCSPGTNASSCVSFCLLLLCCLNHVLPPRDAKDEVLRPGHHHTQGAAGGEPPAPLLERAEPRRSTGVVRFSLDGNQTESLCP